ncbi:MAG: hypothetical protein RLZZ445_1315 [Pseudomonadota bacterium]|jgi:hypothetical protein
MESTENAFHQQDRPVSTVIEGKRKRKRKCPDTTIESEAKALIVAKGIDADNKVVALTEDSLNCMAQALGCVADAIDFDSYPEQ